MNTNTTRAQFTAAALLGLAAAVLFIAAIEVRAEQKSDHVRALLSEAYCVAPAAITK